MTSALATSPILRPWSIARREGPSITIIGYSELWINGTKYTDIPGNGFENRFDLGYGNHRCYPRKYQITGKEQPKRARLGYNNHGSAA